MSVDYLYRGLLVRGAVLKGTPKAAVLAGAARLHVTEGEDLDLAIAAARSWIDRLFAGSAARRRAENVATEEEYIRYFAQHPPAGHELAMLKAHAEAEQNTLTTTQLARAAGWDDWSPANLHYGTLGKRVSDTLGLKPRVRRDGSSIGISALAEGASEHSDEGHWRWRMHDELVAALLKLGLAT